MKKITLLLSALVASLTISAEVFTLDLSKPTNPEAFEFNEAGMWKETWSEAVDFKYFTTQAFQFSHLLSGKSWSGTFWDGFTVSKATADGEGYGYYSNMAKGGLKGVGTPYILAYYNEWWLMDDANEDMMSSNHIIFDGEYYPRYVYLNNALVSYKNVTEGGGVARAFHQGDKFEVWIKGLDADYEESDEKVVYRLADYTSENESEWFVNTEWAKVDLSELGKVSGLSFTVVSTDQGDNGTNTATYFALDGLTVSTTADEPLPVKVAGFENEEGGINLTAVESNWFGADEPIEGMNNWMSGTYRFQTYHSVSEYGVYNAAAVVTNETSTAFKDYNDAYRSASGGAFEGANYAVWYLDGYNNGAVTFDPQVVKGFYVNNNAYAASSMTLGDSFAKKFGAEDFFKLTCTGKKDGEVVGTVDFMLAENGEFVNQWTYVDLSELGEIDALTFSLSSSDNGEWGMNTPAYFCMDNFGAEKPADYVAPERAKFPGEPVTIEINQETIYTDYIAEEGWWQIQAENDDYYISLSNIETDAAPGTYSVAELDEEYSFLLDYSTEPDEEGYYENVTFTAGTVTLAINDETKEVTVNGRLLASDGKVYIISLAYNEPTAQRTVNVNIADGELDESMAEWGLYVVTGTDANNVSVQLGIWVEDEEAENLVGQFTEQDLDDMMVGSGVAEGEDGHQIYTAAINVVPGNKKGEYKLTADLLCYNSTLYKVEIIFIAESETAIDDVRNAVKAVKVINDGQVLIIRDNKAVNMLGAQVR